MSKISEQILEKIEKNKLEPVPNWTFAAKNSIFWTLWALAVLIGAIAVSAMLFVFTHSGWALREVTHPNTIKYIFDLVPYFWIIALALMIIIGLYNVRQTKRGYRYSFILLIIANIVMSILGGLVLFVVGMGELVEEATEQIPFHQSIMEIRRQHWSDPQSGLLAGEVIELSVGENQNYVIVKDFVGDEWTIDISDVSSEEIESLEVGEVTAIVGIAQVESGESIRNMYACAILDWDWGCGEVVSIMSGRFENEERSTNCRGVRPFEALRGLPR